MERGFEKKVIYPPRGVPPGGPRGARGGPKRGSFLGAYLPGGGPRRPKWPKRANGRRSKKGPFCLILPTAPWRGISARAPTGGGRGTLSTALSNYLQLTFYFVFGVFLPYLLLEGGAGLMISPYPPEGER